MSSPATFRLGTFLTTKVRAMFGFPTTSMSQATFVVPFDFGAAFRSLPVRDSKHTFDILSRVDSIHPDTLNKLAFEHYSGESSVATPTVVIQALALGYEVRNRMRSNVSRSYDLKQLIHDHGQSSRRIEMSTMVTTNSIPTTKAAQN